MRRDESPGGHSELKVFPLSPVLEYYGGEPVESGYGAKSYRCPFHEDSQASGTVSTADPDDEWFNCHAADCPKGNAVQIIMIKENLGYGAALERAQEIAGKGDTPVRKPLGRRGRQAGGTRSGAGARTFKRPGRGDRPSSGS